MSGSKGTRAGRRDGSTPRTSSRREALDFIARNRRRPFFLFFATTVPHLALQVPEDSLAEYAGLWPETPYDGRDGYQPQATPRAAYAAMVTRLDRSVGRVLALLAKLELDRDTLVLFASDNGPTFAVGGYDAAFFGGADGFRGQKGSVYEGGIRVPFIARRPGFGPGRARERRRSSPSRTCSRRCSTPPARRPARRRGWTGRAALPVITGNAAAAAARPLYMEFPGYGGQQMARQGRWKAVRRDLLANPAAPIELYDIENDPAEAANIAAMHPDTVARAEGPHGPRAPPVRSLSDPRPGSRVALTPRTPYSIIGCQEGTPRRGAAPIRFSRGTPWSKTRSPIPPRR